VDSEPLNTLRTEFRAIARLAKPAERSRFIDRAVRNHVATEKR
jgi:hypothetical protein